MINTLRLVRGAVAVKDLLPVLTHFHIYGGRIQGGNGRITIDAPCPELKKFDCTVPAERFLKAVDACDGEPKLKVTDAGRLSISRGNFRSVLPLANHEDFPLVEKDGQEVVNDGDLLGVFRALREFVGEDASRPWACGMLLKDGYAYATNNILLGRMPCSWSSFNDPINIPSFALDELLRIGRKIQQIYLLDNAVTFALGDDIWLRSQLFEAQWPDMSKLFQPCRGITVSPELKLAVEKILPFCPDPKFPIIHLGAEGISTADGEMQAQVTGLELPEAIFRAEALLVALSRTNCIDLGAYPAPCPFAGEGGLEGVLVGVRP